MSGIEKQHPIRRIGTLVQRSLASLIESHENRFAFHMHSLRVPQPFSWQDSDGEAPPG